MPHRLLPVRSAAAALAFFALAAFQASAGAATFQILYKFGVSPADLGAPLSGLIADDAGNLFGTSPTGGQGGGGIFQLSPPASTGLPWTFQVLHLFDPANVSSPAGGLTIGPFGELYGATTVSGVLGGGSIYRLDNTAGRPLTVLHTFPHASPAGGALPLAPPIFGPEGLLFGTTSVNPYRGTAFSLSSESGTPSFSTLHAFAMPPDAATPAYTLTADASGNLYGVSASGGASGTGALFNLISQGAGSAEHVLYSFRPFGSPDAYQPLGPVIMGSGIYSHNLFGCSHGGALGGGALYMLAPPAGGSSQWTESLLYSFSDASGSSDPQPEYSNCSLAISDAGQIYGLAVFGGGAHGALFSLNQPAKPGSPWTVTVLHTFSAPNGDSPNGPPLLFGGNIYGTTSLGAGNSYATYHTGVIWEYTP